MLHTNRPQPLKTAAELHRGWLDLVDTDGPFLAIPPLKRVWPQGMPSLAHATKTQLLDARNEFEAAWEALDRDPESAPARESYRTARDSWVKTVLADVAGWNETLAWGEVTGVSAESPNRAIVVTAQAALNGGDSYGALVHLVDPVDSLRASANDLWAATPIDRLEALLRSSGVPIGIVTDGRWWALVCAQEGAMVASGVVDALTWVEEPRARDAFLTLIKRQYLIGGAADERLPVLFAESIAAAEEITEALGAQVRRAVELLIQAFNEAAADATRNGRTQPLPSRPHDTYEAAVTIMMRVVFLLFAEERGLLPSSELFEQGYGISRELDRLASRELDESEEALDATALTWHRLLATSQALFHGGSFENLRMPAYGGSLFDPSRFPFLTQTADDATLVVTVSDRVMLQTLRSVQLAVLRGGEARRISFRDVDVEQIGYIYEGLLGYSCMKVDDAHLGLIGTLGLEPSMPLAKLQELAAVNADPAKFAAAITAWVKEDQPSAKPSSAAAIRSALAEPPDPTTVSALGHAVAGDVELRDRILPLLGLIRLDLRHRPTVALPGGLIVHETPSRRNAGAHYTPRSLAEEVVLYALQPICYLPGPYQTDDQVAWKLKSSDDLLDLKVADIACGSGAFLVAAARYLADRVVEAWVLEDPSNAARRDLHLRAIRQVVANCLYGADINDMAIEMCKLALWLVSLDRDLPFSFVDDKVLLGNSLLGLTDLEQLRRLHIYPDRAPKQIDVFTVDVDAIVRKAVEIRQRLASEIDEYDPARNITAKHRQLRELRDLTADLSKLADGVIAAGLPLGGIPKKTLDEAYVNLRIAAKTAYPEHGAGDATFLDGIIDAGLTPTVATDYERWQPLHWLLAATDVMTEHGGFDAIVGNPPFLNGRSISGAAGTDVRAWFVQCVADGVSGAADLCAYFFLRAARLLRDGGGFGLIATSTIAQGDTRTVGLDQIAKRFTITRAIQSMGWPTTSANLQVAIVWTSMSSPSAQAARVLDGEPVTAITSLLEPEGRISGDPARLAANAQQAFIGSYLNGLGFLVTPDAAREMLRADPLNADVLEPFLTGEDLNSSSNCVASRWTVNFHDWESAKAQRYKAPFDWIQSHLFAYRQGLKQKPSLQERWWVYERRGVRLYVAIAGLTEVLVMTLHTKPVMPSRVPSHQVFSHGLAVFATDSYADQAVLSSSAHQLWAIKYGSGLGTTIRYTPSDVFETFPRPESTARLEAAGRTLDEVRREIMLRRDLGITDVYNLVNDPGVDATSDRDVGRLRQIHVDIDSAVMASYGWSNIELDHGFHSYRRMQRWSVTPAARAELFDRLLEENHRRAAIEAEAGLTAEAPDDWDIAADEEDDLDG
jgi:methylase of polypeptide subunit release factors